MQRNRVDDNSMHRNVLTPCVGPGRLCAAALLLLVSACGTMPEQLPRRTGAPGEEPPATVDVPPAMEKPGYEAPPAAEPDPVFEPVRDALAQGDWMAATLALPQPAGDDPHTAGMPETLEGAGDMALWLSYYRARISLLRGDTAGAEAQLAELRSAALPDDLVRELRWLRLQQARLRGDMAATADNALALWRLGGHPSLSPQACEALVWSAAQLAPAPAAGGDNGWEPWQSLAQAANRPGGRDAVAALERWLGRYADHPARWRAERLLAGALLDAGLVQGTVILPLSGPLERAGEAVQQGILAAYFDSSVTGDDAREGLERLDILDSRRFDSAADAYRQATFDGADLVLGPLGKRQVEEVLNAGGETPLVAMNRPENPVVSLSANALLLSLAPEDEAAQIARRAYGDGARRALVVRPEGVWGDRLEGALLADWKTLGGTVAARAVFGAPQTHSESLENALGLARSSQRARQVRDVFPLPVETQGRRRGDIDVIFLLTKNVDEARSLKPLVNYHYAGDLPVYALSTADDGRDDPAANGDLEGIRLPVMPWRLVGTPPGVENPGDAFAALHAMGADAHALARRWHRLTGGAALGYSGYTAEMTVAADGTLLRQLPMAEFDRGVLVPR